MLTRNICDIVVFHTPLDVNSAISERTKIVREMVDGYLSGMGVSWNTHENITPTTQTIISEFQGTIFTMSFSSSVGLIPSIRASLMPSSQLSKAIVENFLSDIVRIFRGQFFERYFLEYDPIYHLDEMNMGKKYDLDDIAGCDIRSASHDEIVRLLDAIYFLHFRLVRELSRSLDSEENISTLLGISLSSDLVLGLQTSGVRIGEIQQSLISQIAQVRAQIELFNSLLPSLGYSIHS
ncbi:MAG: hypothetical protein U0518_03255 [Candidatus Gracilibacteria bacterium]